MRSQALLELAFWYFICTCPMVENCNSFGTVSLESAVVVDDVAMSPAGSINTLQTTVDHGAIVRHPNLRTQEIYDVCLENLIDATGKCIADPK